MLRQFFLKLFLMEICGLINGLMGYNFSHHLLNKLDTHISSSKTLAVCEQQIVVDDVGTYPS